MHLICSGVPPEVALVIAHAASFLVRNSAFCRISISTGNMLASITACNRKSIKPQVFRYNVLCNNLLVSQSGWSTWICTLFPAVILETVQQASFLMDSFGLLSRWSRQGRAEQFRITWHKTEQHNRSENCSYCLTMWTTEHVTKELHYLGLNIISCYNVPHRSQCRRHHFVITVPVNGQHTWILCLSQW